MKLGLCFLAAALCSPVFAQGSAPVQLVGTGRANTKYQNVYAPTKYESHYAPNPVQNTIASPLRNQGQYPTVQEYVAARGRAQAHAYSPEEAEAWARQYSVNPPNDGTKIDPVTGMPKYSATVTLRHVSRESGGSENVVPHFATSLVNNLWNFSSFVPGRGFHLEHHK